MAKFRHLWSHCFFKMGQPRPLSVYFQEKLYASAGFELGSLEKKASTLTTWPPPRHSSGHTVATSSRLRARPQIIRTVGKEPLETVARAVRRCNICGQEYCCTVQQYVKLKLGEFRRRGGKIDFQFERRFFLKKILQMVGFAWCHSITTAIVITFGNLRSF